VRVAILAGGLGTRLAEETEVRPKPMVEIGGQPIMWHIMHHYAHFGFNEFVIALGYKGDYIRRYFSEYHANSSNLRVDLSQGIAQVHGVGPREDWIVELIETGFHTDTGGRIKRLRPYLGDETFLLTWGDGVSNVNVDKLVAFHRSHGRLATVTAVHPPARFGQVIIEDDQVVGYTESPLENAWINGAFFVLEPEAIEYVEDDDTSWERHSLARLAEDGELVAYRHDGFWQCMDTLREKHLLERMWASGNAPWKIWS
jgi:glucose-1-phosphate cytidylyltransferase